MILVFPESGVESGVPSLVFPSLVFESDCLSLVFESGVQSGVPSLVFQSSVPNSGVESSVPSLVFESNVPESGVPSLVFQSGVPGLMFQSLVFPGLMFPSLVFPSLVQETPPWCEDVSNPKAWVTQNDSLREEFIPSLCTLPPNTTSMLMITTFEGFSEELEEEVVHEIVSLKSHGPGSMMMMLRSWWKTQAHKEENETLKRANLYESGGGGQGGKSDHPGSYSVQKVISVYDNVMNYF
ncbi:hypothetical protein Hamer_G005230 [Homarus americanus]|uniref:Uncharacterized protein n=1 Tax=Homarus americanus TaxID=6706 RepID=A0A8J5MV56_HOMAM|nr:hypothetical protein Hamer_G005230 [Homarus americanus]